MRFTVDQRLQAPIDRVEAALADPAWYQAVAASPAVWEPTLLQAEDDGQSLHLRVRYRFRGELNAAARAVLDPARMSWVEESTLDRQRHHIDLRMKPDHYEGKLSFTGSIDLSAIGDGSSTARRLQGDVKVRMLLVAGQVERAIVSGLKEHAAVEEQAFQGYLDGQSAR
jgi:hypothetical protein